MGAWDAALSFKRVLFFFGILQLLHIVVVAPEWGDGTGPKVVSGHFDILRLEIIGRKPRAGGQDLENGVLQTAQNSRVAIGVSVAFNRPIFARTPYTKKTNMRHFHQHVHMDRNLIAKQTFLHDSVLEIHCFRKETASPRHNIPNQNVSRPDFSGYMVGCKDVYKYKSVKQFSIFDWPCERDSFRGSAKKHKYSGIVPVEDGTSAGQLHRCSLHYVHAEEEQAGIIDFNGAGASLPKNVGRRTDCGQQATLVKIPEKLGGVRPGQGAGLGMYPGMKLLEMKLTSECKPPPPSPCDLEDDEEDEDDEEVPPAAATLRFASDEEDEEDEEDDDEEVPPAAATLRFASNEEDANDEEEEDDDDDDDDDENVQLNSSALPKLKFASGATGENRKKADEDEEDDDEGDEEAPPPAATLRFATNATGENRKKAAEGGEDEAGDDDEDANDEEEEDDDDDENARLNSSALSAEEELRFKRLKSKRLVNRFMKKVASTSNPFHKFTRLNYTEISDDDTEEDDDRKEDDHESSVRFSPLPYVQRHSDEESDEEDDDDDETSHMLDLIELDQNDNNDESHDPDDIDEKNSFSFVQFKQQMLVSMKVRKGDEKCGKGGKGGKGGECAEDPEADPPPGPIDIVVPPIVPELTTTILTSFGTVQEPTAAEAIITSTEEVAVNDIPEELSTMISTEVTTEVSVQVADVIVPGVTTDVTTALVDELPSYIGDGVVDDAEPPLHESIQDILEESIPDGFTGTVAPLTVRALKLSLIHLLTLSVTHAVVPTVSKAMTHNKDQDYWCHQCYYNHKDCKKCHYSPESSYYNNYYSAYYSDYYAKFYADYYSNAMASVDNIQHPGGGSTKKPDPGIAGDVK